MRNQESRRTRLDDNASDIANLTVLDDLIWKSIGAWERFVGTEAQPLLVIMLEIEISTISTKTISILGSPNIMDQHHIVSQSRVWSLVAPSSANMCTRLGRQARQYLQTYGVFRSFAGTAGQ